MTYLRAELIILFLAGNGVVFGIFFILTVPSGSEFFLMSHDALELPLRLCGRHSSVKARNAGFVSSRDPSCGRGKLYMGEKVHFFLAISQQEILIILEKPANA